MNHGENILKSQTGFKTLVLRPSLCYYSDANKLMSKTITIESEGADDAAKQLDEINNEVKMLHHLMSAQVKKNDTQIDMQKIWMLWCRSIIWENTTTFTQKPQKVYGNIIGMN